MRKCYIVVKSTKGSDPENLCVFTREGDAEQSAAKHRSENTKAWVEEVNFYD